MNRGPSPLYRPALEAVLRFPEGHVGDRRALALAITAVPVLRLGGEFMPPLDEGDLFTCRRRCRVSRCPKRPSCCSRRTGPSSHRARGRTCLWQGRARRYSH